MASWRADLVVFQQSGPAVTSDGAGAGVWCGRGVRAVDVGSVGVGGVPAVRMARTACAPSRSSPMPHLAVGAVWRAPYSAFGEGDPNGQERQVSLAMRSWGVAKGPKATVRRLGTRADNSLERAEGPLSRALLLAKFGNACAGCHPTV